MRRYAQSFRSTLAECSASPYSPLEDAMVTDKRKLQVIHHLHIQFQGTPANISNINKVRFRK